MGDLLNATQLPTNNEEPGIVMAKKSRPTDIIGQRQSITELENMVKEMTTVHEEELIALQNALKRHQTDLQKKLNEKDRECDIIKGRLEESRAARECTLQEFNVLSDKYDDLQKYFKLQMTELSKEKDAIKQSLEDAQTVQAAATAAEVDDTEKLRTEVNRLREEKMKFLVDIEQKERDARYRERILVSKSAKLADTQKEFDKAKEDIDKMQSELMVLREFRSSSNENQQLVADKSKRIEDLEKKVGSLNASKDKLKETLIVLDEQLKEFEMTLIDKNEEIEQLRAKMSQLQSENVTFRQVIKDCQTEVNATKNLKVTVEDKMKKVEAAFEKIKTEKDSRVNDFQSQIEQLVTTNQTLEDQFEGIISRNQELEANNEHLRKCVDALRTECSDHRDENAIVVNQYIREKNTNTQHETEIEKVKATNVELVTKLESMQEVMAVLEFEKNEIDVQMKTMLKQQIKLIEYLRSENEILTSKKKKTFVGRILGQKEKEQVVPMSPKSSAKVKETPNCVLREQNIVRYLELEAEKLRQQLNSCKIQESEKENYSKDTDTGVSTAVPHTNTKSTETQTLQVPSQPSSDHGDSDLDSALAAMANAVDGDGDCGSIDSDDLSGYERDLYFAEREKQLRYAGRGAVTETDTEDGF